MDDSILFKELSPVAEGLLNRHLGTAKDWLPHEYVPWSEGRDFEPGEQWEESPATPPAPVRSALFLNLLTEDNLPYYFGNIDRLFGRDHPWREWTRRWTAEEMRHGIVIRDYVTVTRSIDPVALERARMQQVSLGEVPDPRLASQGLVYVALQELATRIAHHNTGKQLGDSRGRKLMARVAADENLHHLFYRDLVTAAIEVDPSTMVLAMADQVPGFQMPGTGVPDFAAHARAIAGAGIFDLGIMLEHVLAPVVRSHWHLQDLTGLTPEAEAARDKVLNHLDRMARVVARQASRRPSSTTGASVTV